MPLRLLQGQQVVMMASSATVSLATVALLLVAPEVLSGDDALDGAGLGLSLLLVAGGLGMVAALLIGLPIWGYWHHTAARNLSVFGRAGAYTPAAHVYWWFVPFANLVVPYRTTKELLVHSHPASVDVPDGGYDPAIDDDTFSAPLVDQMPLWWGLHLGGNILSNAAGRMDAAAQGPGMSATAMVAAVVGAVATVLALGAMVLYLRIVGQVTADQAELARSQGV